MTLAVVIMIGTGVLFVISAIENSSLVATFQALWSRQPLSSLAPSTGASPSSGGTKPPSNVTQIQRGVGQGFGL